MLLVQGNLSLQSNRGSIEIDASDLETNVIFSDWKVFKEVLRTKHLFSFSSLKRIKKLSHLKAPIKITVGQKQQLILSEGKVKKMKLSTGLKIGWMYLKRKL
ncbi:MAG: hypothetical protein AAFY41_15220 [Bacteroidota bacterium]